MKMNEIDCALTNSNYLNILPTPTTSTGSPGLPDNYPSHYVPNTQPTYNIPPFVTTIPECVSAPSPSTFAFPWFDMELAKKLTELLKIIDVDKFKKLMDHIEITDDKIIFKIKMETTDVRSSV